MVDDVTTITVSRTPAAGNNAYDVLVGRDLFNVGVLSQVDFMVNKDGSILLCRCCACGCTG